MKQPSLNSPVFSHKSGGKVAIGHVPIRKVHVSVFVFNCPALIVYYVSQLRPSPRGLTVPWYVCRILARTYICTAELAIWGVSPDVARSGNCSSARSGPFSQIPTHYMSSIRILLLCLNCDQEELGCISAKVLDTITCTWLISLVRTYYKLGIVISFKSCRVCYWHSLYH